MKLIAAANKVREGKSGKTPALGALKHRTPSATSRKAFATQYVVPET
jgi:hypothetical protein